MSEEKEENKENIELSAEEAAALLLASSNEATEGEEMTIGGIITDRDEVTKFLEWLLSQKK